MDPIEQMLIEKGIDKDDAYAMAMDIRKGIAKDPEAMRMREEAYTNVAQDETARLERMAHNARMFTHMHKVKQEGGKLEPKDEQWYGYVLAKNKEMYAKRAKEAGGRHAIRAREGITSSENRGRQLAGVAMRGTQQIQQGVDNAMATHEINKDQLVNQLIPYNPRPAATPIEQAQQGIYQGLNRFEDQYKASNPGMSDNWNLGQSAINMSGQGFPNLANALLDAYRNGKR